MRILLHPVICFIVISCLVHPFSCKDVIFDSPASIFILAGDDTENVIVTSHEDHGAAESETGDQVPAVPLVPSASRKHVRCVVCTSDPHEEGGECVTNPTKFVKDCVNPVNSRYGNYTGCRKIEQWVDYEMNTSDPGQSNHHRIIRQCAYFGQYNPCVHSTNLGGKQYTCYCQGDACNPSSRTSHSLFVLLPLITIAIIASGESNQVQVR